MLVSSEFTEAGRCIANGFCTPDRTLLISSTSRFYVINEKMALGDGRFDEARLLDVAEKNSQSRILFDMESVAKEAGAMTNAVMLGAIAGCGKLPIPAETFEEAIRSGRQGGGRQPARLQGRTDCSKNRSHRPEAPHRRQAPREAAPNDLATLENEIRETMPESAQDFMIEGVRRLTRFQDGDYARLFLDRLGRLARSRYPRRRQAIAGDSAASRRSHVVRGSDPRRASQDRPRPHAADFAGAWREGARTIQRH